MGVQSNSGPDWKLALEEIDMASWQLIFIAPEMHTFCKNKAFKNIQAQKRSNFIKTRHFCIFEL